MYDAYRMPPGCQPTQVPAIEVAGMGLVGYTHAANWCLTHLMPCFNNSKVHVVIMIGITV